MLTLNNLIVSKLKILLLKNAEFELKKNTTFRDCLAQLQVADLLC